MDELTIGQSIRKHRMERGMTLAVLSELADIKAENLCSIEHGKHEPSWWTLMRLARVMGTGFIRDALDGEVAND